jgi:uncharacterized membrane protein
MKKETVIFIIFLIGLAVIGGYIIKQIEQINKAIKK